MAQQTTAFTLTLIVRSPLVPTVTALPPATVGQPYSFQLTVTGGVPPYLWSATGLPPGLTCSPLGILSGTPTALSPSGSYTVGFTVTDSGT